MKIQRNIQLAKYTTFHVGGPAKFFAEVNSVDELKKAVDFSRKKNLTIFVLGGGSNILLPDKGIDGLVLKVNIREIIFQDNVVSVGAGERWDKVVARAVQKNLSGIENLSLIPGTVGGAVYQNIGAYGVELKDVLKSVEVFNKKTKEVKKLSVQECNLKYRNSIFQSPQGSRYIILKAVLKLSKNSVSEITYHDLIKYFEDRDNPTIQDVRSAVIKIRKSKLDYPTAGIGTAGSFFKNPVITIANYRQLVVKYPDIKGQNMDNKLVKLSAGQLIEKLGWKGKRIKNAGVSHKHALVLISYGGATSKDLIELSRLIQKSVKDKFGIKLEPEVKIIYDKNNQWVNTKTNARKRRKKTVSKNFGG